MGSVGTSGGSARLLRVVLIGAQPEYLINLRGQLLRDLVAAGHDVTAVGDAESPDVAHTLSQWGVKYATVPLSRMSLNPLDDWRTFRAFRDFFRRTAPDAMLVYTTKSIVWALLGARSERVPHRYAMVAGRGFALVRQPGLRATALRLVTKSLLAMALRTADGVVFQNEDDLALFRKERLVPARIPVSRVYGSGVELDRFTPLPLPQGPVTFLLVGRLLKSKGIAEFVSAAKSVRERLPDTRFLVVGPEDPGPNAIPASQLASWKSEGIVEFAGYAADVRPYLAQCHVFVLPSTAEGVPRSILEALASGRAIITTDTPGCRDTVLEGRNGVLVPFGDANALADAMTRMASDPQKLRAAAIESRKLAEQRFDACDVSAGVRRAMGLG